MLLLDLPSELITLVIEKCDKSDREMLRESCSDFKRLVDTHSPDLPKELKVSAFVSSVALMRWAVNHGCPLSAKTCRIAAREGSIEVMKFLRAERCPWDARVCLNATRYGHLDLLRWARDHGCGWNFLVCAVASENESLVHIRQWLDQIDCPCRKAYH